MLQSWCGILGLPLFPKIRRKKSVSLEDVLFTENTTNGHEVEIGRSAFSGDKLLSEIVFSENVVTIDIGAFWDCTALSKVQLPIKLRELGAYAFSGINIASITIPCTMERVISTGYPKSITIPAKVKKIGSKAFYQCKNLRYILVKTKKLTAKNVGSNAFGKGAAKLWVKTDKNKWKLYAWIFTARGMSVKALNIIDPVKLVL